jgi:hypothetical protein
LPREPTDVVRRRQADAGKHLRERAAVRDAALEVELDPRRRLIEAERAGGA